MAVPAILLFALLHDYGQCTGPTHAILDTVAVLAMDSAVLLHVAIMYNALVQMGAHAILDTLAICAMPSTVRYVRMEESVIMLERIRIVVHVTIVGKARFAIFLSAILLVVA